MDTFKKLKVYMAGREALLPLALIFSAVSAVAGIIPYVLIWYIIRELMIVGVGFSAEFISVYAWWAVIAGISSIVFYFVALSFSHLAAFRVETNMRRLAMGKIVKMPLGFFDINTTGKIRKVIDDNASITHGFLAHQLPDLAATILMPLMVLVLIFAFDWRMGLVCLIPIVFSMAIMSFMMSEKGKEFMRNYMTSLEDMNTEAVEYVRGIPVVKVFQQTVFSFKNFHKSIVQYKKMVSEYTNMWEKPMSAYSVIINGFAFFLVPVAILIISYTGNYALTILNLFLYILITPILSQSIMRSMYLNQAFGQASEAVQRLERLTDYSLLEVNDKIKKIKRHSIKFENVSFSYPGASSKAIENVSFEISEGKTYALVGASGSGKTTVARLTTRFWDVDEGNVYIGDASVKMIEAKELMDNISFVFQNTHLFKMSLMDNIKYGKPSASMKEVKDAVEMAQCHEIISKLPKGLDTKIGTEGTYLSGGEQQRVALARAMLKNAPIVVLDEATAFTDPENEHLIQEAFGKLTDGKTVLMIAHRLSSVITADCILVMKEGRIIEQGTHNELLQQQGVYANMWNEFKQANDWKI